MEETVAFFALETTKDKKGYLGAILVTDDLGMPQEFRVTYPVKPTSLQRQLYGESLLVHIGVTLCAGPLCKALRNKPEIIIINDRQYLPLAKDISSAVVCVERTGEAFVVGEDEGGVGTKKVQSPSGRFQPLTTYFPPGYDEQRQGALIKSMEEYFQVIDLSEPFERIKSALEALAEQDERFR